MVFLNLKLLFIQKIYENDTLRISIFLNFSRRLGRRLIYLNSIFNGWWFSLKYYNSINKIKCSSKVFWYKLNIFIECFFYEISNDSM